MKPSEMASLSNFRWQNVEIDPQNGDMDERVKRPVSDGVW